MDPFSKSKDHYCDYPFSSHPIHFRAAAKRKLCPSLSMSYPLRPSTPAWCKSLPKVELHAHLSGSVRSETIRKLLNQPRNEHIRARALKLIDSETRRSLQQCFELFSVIHQLITDEQSLRMITWQVLDDFARDNTVYLELRTTPRQCETLSAEEYLLTVLRTMADYLEAHPDGMVCRLLISVSRHLPVSVAKETITLIHKHLNMGDLRLKSLIVGIELSGNPCQGRWSDFEPLLTRARRILELPVSLHFGEISNEKECLEMLDFKPDRVGHAVVLSETVAKRLISQTPKIGVEVCLTSNLFTESVQRIAEHPLITTLLPEKHPFCLCTDDPGVFNTSLSDEYGRLLEYFELSQTEVEQIALRGLDMAFCPDENLMNRVRLTASSKLRRNH